MKKGGGAWMGRNEQNENDGRSKSDLTGGKARLRQGEEDVAIVAPWIL